MAYVIDVRSTVRSSFSTEFNRDWLSSFRIVAVRVVAPDVGGGALEVNVERGRIGADFGSRLPAGQTAAIGQHKGGQARHSIPQPNL